MKRALSWLVGVRGPQRAVSVAGAYRDLFAGAPGQAVLRDLARFGRIAETSFVLGDAHATAFNEGTRAAVLHVLELAGVDPVALAQSLQQETD